MAERVLAIPRRAFRRYLGFQGVRVDDGLILDALLAERGLRLLPKRAANAQPGFKQLVTYALIRCDDYVLSFKRGKTQRVPRQLRGQLCLGFGGHVNQQDYQAVGSTRDRVIHSVLRELTEEISLPTTVTRRIGETIHLAGVLNDDTSLLGQRHVGVVFVAHLTPGESLPTATTNESEITEVSWKTRAEILVSVDELELWSRMCIAAGLLHSYAEGQASQSRKGSTQLS